MGKARLDAMLPQGLRTGPTVRQLTQIIDSRKQGAELLVAAWARCPPHLYGL